MRDAALIDGRASGRVCLKGRALSIRPVAGDNTLTRCYRAEVSQAEHIGKGREGRLSCGAPIGGVREVPEGSRHDASRMQAYGTCSSDGIQDQLQQTSRRKHCGTMPC